MDLSEYSSESVGFDSTWDRDKQVLVKDAATDVMSLGIQLLDKLSSTNETNEIGVEMKYNNKWIWNHVSVFRRFKQRLL